jgi:hypothetical protein
MEEQLVFKIADPNDYFDFGESIYSPTMIIDPLLTVPTEFIQIMEHILDTECIERMNNSLKKQLNIIFRKLFDSDCSFYDGKKQKRYTSSSVGKLNGQIAEAITPAIEEYLEEICPNDFKSHQIDGSDFICVNRYGDWKLGIVRDEFSDFTCNGSSHKLGYYTLLKLEIDEYCSMKNTSIQKIFLGIVNDKATDGGLRPTKKLDGTMIKADRAALHIPIEYHDVLHVIRGYTRQYKTMGKNHLLKNVFMRCEELKNK